MPTSPTQVFKLRYPNGLYSTGGSKPRGHKRGKSWTVISHIKTHLKQGGRYPPGMVIVTFELVETDTHPLDALLTEKQRKAAEKLGRALQEVQKAEADRTRRVEAMIGEYSPD